MKKSIIVILLALMLTLAGCSDSDKADMSGYDLLTVRDHNFITGDYSEILNKMTNHEPGIYYFGYPTCPWCRELIPELQEVLSETGLVAYAININNDSWTLNLNNALKEFGSQFETDLQYQGVPYVIIIGDDGDATAHVGTVATHNANQREMTDNERAYLKRVLRDSINEVGLTNATNQ